MWRQTAPAAAGVVFLAGGGWIDSGFAALPGLSRVNVRRWAFHAYDPLRWLIRISMSKAGYLFI